SRREIEKWISLGRISLNGKRAKLGDRANLNDRLLLDGELVRLTSQRHEQIKALIYHKPEGEICTRKDPKGRPTIFDNLPDIANGRWVSVGRLDINTSGLILLTNNGELANKLMHPSTGVEREYLVRIRGKATEETINSLTKEGVTIDGKIAHFESVVNADLAEEGTNHWYRVVIKEGRYREVRRMWDEVGHTVSRLKRIRYGTVKLTRNIKLGQHAKMAPKQIEKLVNAVDLGEAFQAQLYSAGRNASRPPLKTARKVMTNNSNSRKTSARNKGRTKTK
ncbi:UNVERIFIED_CONTAM: hypothetical protein GTU68_066539, partial [Idotea baltica]|nr:hypothetical protein [Idotea baltica]